MAGHLNGSGRKAEEPPDNVASLADARRRAAEKAKAAKRAERDQRAGGASTLRDWIIGGVVLVMAFAMIWHWVAPLVTGTGGAR